MSDSPLFRLIQCGKTAIDSAREAQRRSLSFRCVNCSQPVAVARLGEMQAKFCAVCTEKAAKAGAGLLAEGAEKVFEVVLRGVFGRRPR